MSTRDFSSINCSLGAVDLLEPSKVELCATQAGEVSFSRAVAQQPLSALCDEYQHRAVAVEILTEYAGRREVFGTVKSLCLLFPVKKIAIPNGIAQEKRVCLCNHCWDVGI